MVSEGIKDLLEVIYINVEGIGYSLLEFNSGDLEDRVSIERLF